MEIHASCMYPKFWINSPNQPTPGPEQAIAKCTFEWWPWRNCSRLQSDANPKMVGVSEPATLPQAVTSCALSAYHGSPGADVPWASFPVMCAFLASRCGPYIALTHCWCTLHHHPCLANPIYYGHVLVLYQDIGNNPWHNVFDHLSCIPLQCCIFWKVWI